jgi:hypothetical protein
MKWCLSLFLGRPIFIFQWFSIISIMLISVIYFSLLFMFVPIFLTITHIGKAVPQHTYGGAGGERMYSSYSFTTSALDGWWVVSVSPGGRTPGTHWTGGWVCTRAGLDSEVRGKISCLCRVSNLDRPVVQPLARHYTDWATRLTFIHVCSYFLKNRAHVPLYFELANFPFYPHSFGGPIL